MESAERADEVMLEWLKGFFSAIDHLLPPKFLVYAPSNGAYQMGLYASAFPDRIEKLFLCCPVGFAGIESDYDPYSIRVSDKVNAVPPREKVDQLIEERESKRYAFGTLVDVPLDERQGKFLRMAKAEFEGYPDGVHVAMGAYKDLMFSWIGALEAAYRVPFKYFF